ncbi:MAG: hypothetical protein LWW77_00720 [Propionibacteriales bacterium]|nr:hypothetical protein [Propionibacteriales bacterium]
MRILIPMLDFGASGGYRVLAELGNRWHAAGVDCAFVVPWFAGDARFPVSAPVLYVDSRGRTRSRDTRDLSGIRRVVLAQLALTRGIRRLVEPSDVVFSNHFLTTIAAFGSEKRGAAHVRLMQAEEAEYYPGGSLKARMFRALVRRADERAPYVIVNSPEFLVGDERRIGVLPPGIDLTLFHPDEPAARPLTIGTVGRSEPWKGTHRVLQSVRQASLPGEYVLSVADFGAELAEFGDLPIRTTTPRSDAELADWYRSVDFVVVGGSGQPGAYHYPCLEALATGATLVTPWYRPADAANAWLVEEPEPAQLAAAIDAALAHPEERASKRAAGLAAVKDLDWDHLAASAMEMIRRAAEH